MSSPDHVTDMLLIAPPKEGICQAMHEKPRKETYALLGVQVSMSVFRTSKLALVAGLLVWVFAGGSVQAAATTSKATPVPLSAPTISTVIEKVNALFADVKDISGTVDLDQISSDGTTVSAQTKVQGRLPNLLRLQFVKPETFAGAIFVIDRKANQVLQYSPITEQVIITGINQVVNERFVPTTVEQLFSLPSPVDYDLAVIGVEGNLVQVSARAKQGNDAPFFHFFIDQQQWLVSKMKVYDQTGKPLFNITLRDVKLNQNITDAQIKKMPPGAVAVYR